MTGRVGALPHRAASPRQARAARSAGLALPRLGLRPNRAAIVAAAIVALSALGMIYITQISHVARYGYRLSALQAQQARLDREE